MKIKNGFTLVEVAIVLIIIGLFMGTVLKGTELITNAKIKNIENNFSSIARAITIYRENYHQLPGDDDAVSRFGISIKGDGNGVINGNFASNTNTNTDESRKLWLHLRSANLVERVPGDLQQQPQNAFNGLMGISSDSSSVTNPTNDNGAQGSTNMVLFVGFTKIPGNIAVILESHSDDAKAGTGQIRSNVEDYEDGNGTAQVEHNLYFSL